MTQKSNKGDNSKILKGVSTSEGERSETGGYSHPHWFDTSPKFTWGFYAYRYDLYNITKPHDGYNILRK